MADVRQIMSGTTAVCVIAAPKFASLGFCLWRYHLRRGARYKTIGYCGYRWLVDRHITHPLSITPILYIWFENLIKMKRHAIVLLVILL
jgi:hypothetical protein